MRHGGDDAVATAAAAAVVEAIAAVVAVSVAAVVVAGMVERLLTVDNVERNATQNVNPEPELGERTGVTGTRKRMEVSVLGNTWRCEEASTVRSGALQLFFYIKFYVKSFLTIIFLH